MNNADKNPDYKKIYKISCKFFTKNGRFSSGAFDETFYALRVFETAKQLIKELGEKVKTEEVLTATLLHDIGKSKLKLKKVFRKDGWREDFREEWHKHPKYSAELAKPILKKLGHSQEFIENVCYLIENHDKRDNFSGEKSLELKIIQDADYVGDTGFAGFIRPFCYSGSFKKPVISQIQYMNIEGNSRMKPEKLNLKESIRLIKENDELEKSLLKSMNSLIDSELLQ